MGSNKYEGDIPASSPSPSTSDPTRPSAEPGVPPTTEEKEVETPVQD